MMSTFINIIYAISMVFYIIVSNNVLYILRWLLLLVISYTFHFQGHRSQANYGQNELGLCCMYSIIVI